MLEIQRIREDKEAIAAALDKRNIDATETLNEILKADEERRKTQVELDNTLAESNKLAKEIGQLFREGKVEEANAAKARTADLKVKGKELNDALQTAEEKQRELIVSLPNTPHESVVKGAVAEDNVEVSREGDFPTLHANAKPHWELTSEYDLIDFELGVKVTGAGFPVYTNKGARLQRALINYFLDKNTSAGYREFIPPFFVNEDSGFGTGQLPDKEGQMYHMTEDNLYAIPTAEVPLTNMFRDEIVDEAALPIKCTAYTPCFRREAGSYGKDVRGLNRLHQFDKVEIVVLSKPEESYTRLDEMVEHVAGLLRDLKLPFRVLRLCGGDMGFTSALTYDFEVWSAAQERWLEVSSVSNFETFQANRLKLRYRDSDRKTQLCHTLNGSSLALPRIVAALLENHQDENGINIPEVLHTYTGFERIEK
ncbi:MAG: serine--tRNA ligase [Bacteroidetes bacterium]|nr:MAG: serine--tRNA ligase [Bacteroidota bacterium]